MASETTRVYYLRDSETLYQGGLAYASAFAAGMDLRACQLEEEVEIAPGERFLFPAGVIVETPCHLAAFVYSRSGLGAHDGIIVAQGVGVIDPDYRGEIMVYLLNTSHTSRVIKRGERIAQLVFQPVIRVNPEPVSSLTDLSVTARGAGGFGHTGKV